jgi:hypothetical protein
MLTAGCGPTLGIKTMVERLAEIGKNAKPVTTGE